MFLFLAVAAALVTLYLFGRALTPLTDRSQLTNDDWTRIEDESQDLLLRRDRLVNELKDLESEAAMNKIDSKDFDRLRAAFEADALEVVRRLDERSAEYARRMAVEAAAPAAPVVDAAAATTEAAKEST